MLICMIDILPQKITPVKGYFIFTQKVAPKGYFQITINDYLMIEVITPEPKAYPLGYALR